MAIYKAPLRDMRFVLHEVLDAGNIISQLPEYADATPDVIDQVLEEAAKFAENKLFPINCSGDEEGCHFADGVVTTPKGFKEAYDAFCEGGWPSLDADPEYGGQGLPHVLELMVSEMMMAANMAWTM